jgi:DNA-binding transcriptional MerR regulator
LADSLPDRRGMLKIRDLVERTGVSKETVHFYIREGLLPKPRKRGKNIADYTETHVERIRMIKELQDNYFLPLSLIKNILKFRKKSPEGGSLLRLRSDYFRPVDRLLPGEIVGEEEFRKATGIGKKWLEKMEEWEIITPGVREGVKVYSQDDIMIGRLIVEMDEIGLGPKDGFDPEALRHYRQMFREIVVVSHKYFAQASLGKLNPEEYSRKIVQGREIMSTFFYHLYRKLSREEYKRILAMIESQAQDPERLPIAPPALKKRPGKEALRQIPNLETLPPSVGHKGWYEIPHGKKPLRMGIELEEIDGCGAEALEENLQSKRGRRRK